MILRQMRPKIVIAAAIVVLLEITALVVIGVMVVVALLTAVVVAGVNFYRVFTIWKALF